MSTYDKLVGATAEGLLPPAVLSHLSTPANTPTGSVSAVEYWVSPTGSDTAAGTNAAPFKTIARAVATIPDVIRAGHTHTITLMAGDWNEQLAVQNKIVNGQLTVRGATTDRYAHTIRDAYTINVQGHYRIENIHSSKTVPGVHFRYHASGPRMELSNVSGTGEVAEVPFSSGNQGVLADYGSIVACDNSKFDYKDYGLRANYGSTVMSRDNTGIGNTHGVGARFGGYMGVFGTFPEGKEGSAAFSSGGTISHGTGGYTGVQRFSPFLGKSDTYGLVEQTTLQGQGNITPTKKWVSRGTTTRQTDLGGMGDGGGAIPDGSRLRTYFQMTTATSCPTAIEVMAVWQPIGFSGSRYAKVVLVSTISQTGGSAVPTIVASSAAGAAPVVLGHTGSNGIFYIDFTPNGGANFGTYGLNIEISNMHHLDAPIMLGAEVLAP